MSGTIDDVTTWLKNLQLGERMEGTSDLCVLASFGFSFKLSLGKYNYGIGYKLI